MEIVFPRATRGQRFGNVCLFTPGLQTLLCNEGGHLQLKRWRGRINPWVCSRRGMDQLKQTKAEGAAG